jgi:hypothetical protein
VVSITFRFRPGAQEDAPDAGICPRRAPLAYRIAPVQAASLLWASYLIGMELPGERAVFSQLRLTFSPEATASPAATPIYERRPDIRQAILTLACIKICASALFSGFC